MTIRTIGRPTIAQRDASITTRNQPRIRPNRVKDARLSIVDRASAVVFTGHLSITQRDDT